MKHLIPTLLLAASTLGACTNKTADSTLASKHELSIVMNLPHSKEIELDTTSYGATMEADRKEEFVANCGLAHGDTTATPINIQPDSLTDAQADSIYYHEFIEPGPH